MAQEFRYHGELLSRDGLVPVAEALGPCSWRIELRRSGYDGTLYLQTPRSQGIDLEMPSGQSRRFLFSGTVEGPLDRALSLLAEFSRRLTEGGYEHRVEIYDEAEDLTGYLHHRWPRGQPEPSD